MSKKPSRQAQWEAERKAEGWKRVRLFLSPDQIAAIKETGQSMQGFVTEAVERAIERKKG